MANKIFIGTAPKVAQVVTLTPGGTIESGDKFKYTIGTKVFSYSATGTTVASVTAGFVAAWNLLSSTEFPEFAEMTAADGTTNLTLTADKAGVAFGGTASTTESDDTAADLQTFTQSTTTANKGPEEWSSAENWLPSGVPVSADDVTFDRLAHVLYGLNQSAVTLTSLTFEASFGAGTVGLPLRNPGGYNEHRTHELNIKATTVNIRGGGGRIKLNLDSAATTVNVDDSGQPAESNVPAVLLRGTNAANVLNVEKGSVGSALSLGDVATWATVRMSHKTNVASDADLRLGAGCTLTTIDKHGGTLQVNSSFTTLSNNEGIALIEAGTPGQINCRGGTVFYNTSGTLGGNTVVSGAGHLDFSRDARAKTVTNPIEVHGSQAKVSDPFKVVSSLVLDINEEGNSNNFNIGRNIRLTRGTPA